MKRIVGWVLVPVAAAIAVVVIAAMTITLPWSGSNLFGERNAPGGPSETQQFFVTVGALVGLLGIPSAVAGLFFVYQQQVTAADERRREHSPLVRVDLIPADPGELRDMGPVSPYFDSDTESIVFNDYEGDGSRAISVLLRNMQAHPLGVAYNVEASFVLVARGPDGSVAVRVKRFDVPYLYHERPVRLQLTLFPRTWWVAARLSNLVYSDLYLTDRALPAAHEGVHGRLMCTYDASTFLADPVFFPTPKAMRDAAVAFARGV